MNKWSKVLLCTVGLFVPFLASAQSVAQEIHSLQDVLKTLYDDTLPLCSKLIGIGRSIAGFAATWYIGSRVWRHLAAAEPVDFYPLFRPFALGLAILLFPSVLSIMNGVLEPTVTGTGKLVQNSNETIAALLKQKEEEIKKTDKWKALVGDNGQGDRDLWMQYYHKDEIGDEGFFGSIGNDIAFSMDKMLYNMRNSVKHIIAIILQILYEAAALCINTLRTFKLIILAVIGPLVLGLAVFDGFQHLLQVYLARYINIYLWLPIANILGALLGKIQENMIKLDMTQIQQTGDTFFSSYDLGYMIFMIIGILCYFTVPSIADEVVFVGGGTGMQQRVTNVFNSASRAGNSATTYTGAGMAGDMYNDAKSVFSNGAAPSGSGNYFNDNDSHQRNRLSGNA